MHDWFVLAQNMTPGNTPAAPAAPATPAAPAAEGTATTVIPGSPAATEPKKDQPNGFMSLLVNLGPIILIFVVLYFFMFRGQRKEEKKRKLMLSELKKGDRIMTIGGLKGSVVEIREADEEVIIKIDESSNVKARFTRSAIQKVFEGDGKTETK